MILSFGLLTGSGGAGRDSGNPIPADLEDENPHRTEDLTDACRAVARREATFGTDVDGDWINPPR